MDEHEINRFEEQKNTSKTHQTCPQIHPLIVPTFHKSIQQINLTFYILQGIPQIIFHFKSPVLLLCHSSYVTGVFKKSRIRETPTLSTDADRRTNTKHTAQCTLYTLHYKMQTTNSTLHTAYYTLQTTYFTHHTEHSTLNDTN